MVQTKQLFLLIQKLNKLTVKELLIYSYLVWQRRYEKPTTLYLLRKEFGFRPAKIKQWVENLRELGLVSDDLTALEPPAGWFNVRAGAEWWDRLQYTPVGWPQKGQSWITLATHAKRKSGLDNKLVARQLGCTSRSVRNAGMTLRAKEQKIDEMVAVKEVNLATEDFGKPWLEAKLRDWCDEYSWNEYFPRHCQKIQDALKAYPSSQVEKLWHQVVSKLDYCELIEHFVNNFGGCWRLITNSSSQVPTLSYIENGLLRQADNLAGFARTHDTYVLWEPVPYKG